MGYIGIQECYEFLNNLRSIGKMGLSASQGRLLFLTARLSDLEFKAQMISNDKIRLAQQSEQISNKYIDALDKQQLNMQVGYNPSTQNPVFREASINLIMQSGISGSNEMILKNMSGKVIVSQKIADAFKVAMDYVANDTNRNSFPSEADFIRDGVGYATKEEAEAAGKTYQAEEVRYREYIYKGIETFAQLGFGMTYSEDNVNQTNGALTLNPNAFPYYEHIFEEMKNCGYVVESDENMASEDWLYGQLKDNQLVLEKYSRNANSGKGGFVGISVSTDTSFVNSSDQNAITKATAEYNYEMGKINAKDKRYDLQLKNIDTEHNAVQTEVDSVKKVIDKNIERNFKMFDA